jgi:hypothetical protein
LLYVKLDDTPKIQVFSLKDKKIIEELSQEDITF